LKSGGNSGNLLKKFTGGNSRVRWEAIRERPLQYFN